MKHFAENWYDLTSDKFILDTIKHHHIEFEMGNYPKQYFPQRQIPMNQCEREILDQEIVKLLDKGIIENCAHEPGEFISNVFLRKKKDSSYRMILNLKKFNEHVAYHKFKMDTLQAVLKLVKP